MPPRKPKAVLQDATAPAAAASDGTNSQDELERILATRPKRKLTPEEKVHRRRLQYKLHQRRHRAKEKDRHFELEVEVCQLAERVANLTDNWHMLQNRNVFQSRVMLAGAPTKVALGYVDQFAFGYVHQRRDTQEQFLRSVMMEDVDGPDYKGIDVLMEQWRLYSGFFQHTHCVAGAVDVSTIGEMTIVLVDVNFTIRPRRSGVICLCPNVVGNERVLQAMIGKAIHVPGKLRFVFDESGVCSWFGCDMDFVSGLQRALGSLDSVSACVQDANIDFCTGQITPTV